FDTVQAFHVYFFSMCCAHLRYLLSFPTRRSSDLEGPHSGPAWKRLLKDPWAAPLNAARLDAPLALRTREPGDRFAPMGVGGTKRSEEHTSELQSRENIVCRLLLEKQNTYIIPRSG